MSDKRKHVAGWWAPGSWRTGKVEWGSGGTLGLVKGSWLVGPPAGVAVHKIYVLTFDFGAHSALNTETFGRSRDYITRDLTWCSSGRLLPHSYRFTT